MKQINKPPLVPPNGVVCCVPKALVVDLAPNPLPPNGGFEAPNIAVYLTNYISKCTVTD